MAFVDKCIIEFKAGNGGDGIVAWRREAHVPLGGPAGGDGGDGGNIIIIGDYNENSLQNVKYLKKITAENGAKGDIKTMQGKSGKDTYIKVPIGTIIMDYETNEIIVDIIEDKQEYIICHGGMGGKGNYHFKSNKNKAPTLYELGEIGEYKKVILTLKYIADVGIIGLPNAGKSTFLSKISAAKPKIADYQFTTLIPNLGVVYYQQQKIIFADIPGLIEGASKGLGLGHDFLKHIERTKILLHIISMNPNDSDDVINDYQTILNELKIYDHNILKKPHIILCNKMDCENAEINYKKISNFLKNEQIFAISALNDDNLLNEIINAIVKILNNKTNDIPTNEKVKIIDKNFYETKINHLDKTLLINKIEDHVFEINCEFLKYWAHRIPLNTNDNKVRFNQKLKTVNLEEELIKKGAMKNDTIIIYNVRLSFDY